MVTAPNPPGPARGVSVSAICLVLAIIVFALAALGVEPWKLKMVPTGLFFFALSFLV
jgi:hypothetical protein